jgi:tetratricopeptide (TPR) repeat protein
MNRVLQGIFVLALAVAGSLAWAQGGVSACGNPFSKDEGAGPYDYRKKNQNLDKFKTIEGAHFPPSVELLIRGKTTVNIGGDIAYTLRAIPNHHRALVAMVKLGAREKTVQPKGSAYTIDCWFDRAVRYTPDDIVVRLLFAQYLATQSRRDAALEQVEVARGLAGDSGLWQYNIGLVLLEMKQYDQALIQAHKALALDYPRTQLKEQLVAAGKWAEPPAASPSAASAAPPAAAASAPTD